MYPSLVPSGLYNIWKNSVVPTSSPCRPLSPFPPNSPMFPPGPYLPAKPERPLIPGWPWAYTKIKQNQSDNTQNMPRLFDLSPKHLHKLHITHFLTRWSRVSVLPWRTTQTLTKQQHKHFKWSFMPLHGGQMINAFVTSSHLSSYWSLHSGCTFISFLSLKTLWAPITRRSCFTSLTLQPTVLSCVSFTYNTITLFKCTYSLYWVSILTGNALIPAGPVGPNTPTEPWNKALIVLKIN